MTHIWWVAVGADAAPAFPTLFPPQGEGGVPFLRASISPIFKKTPAPVSHSGLPAGGERDALRGSVRIPGCCFGVSSVPLSLPPPLSVLPAAVWTDWQSFGLEAP